MMKKNKFNTKKDERSNSPFELKKKFCPFSQPGSPEIDYKDIKLLSRYLIPLLSVEIITSVFFNKWSQRIVAGMTWPPEPPVEIKIFLFI